MINLSDGLTELRRKLRHGGFENGDVDVLTLKLSDEFEPHGRASEAWDDIWRLTLHGVPRCWPTSNGDWVECSSGEQTFRGREPEDCVRQAIMFMGARRITQAVHKQRVERGFYKALARKGT